MNCNIENCTNESKSRGMCRYHYNKWRKHGNALHNNKLEKAPDICIVDGCSKKTRSTNAYMCEMHYYRLRRNGTIELKDIKPKEFFINTGGYIKDLDIKHPLSDTSGYVYRHRKVLFNSNPSMNCVHCGTIRTWKDCHVDHLDDNIKNNNLENLGISCPTCNQNRGRHKTKQSIRKKYAIHQFNGETLCSSEWAERLGITNESMHWRLKNWTNKKDIFTKKRGLTGPVAKCHQTIHSKD